MPTSAPSTYDMSGAGEPPETDAASASELLNDARYRRHYRTAATTLGIFVILALVAGLGRIILAITSVPAGALQAAKAATAAAPAASAASAPASAAAAATQSVVSVAADTLLNPTGAVVGLVASLTVAITVLTIALVRSTFYTGSKPDPEVSASLPSLEATKAMGQILESVGKALGGGKV